MKYTTVKELQDALSEQKQMADKVHLELNSVVSRASSTMLLDINGAPTPESLARVERDINGLLGKYLNAPTLLEAGALSLFNLEQNSIRGASFAVALLMGATVFSPLSQMTPVLAPTIKPLFQAILTEATSDEGVSGESLILQAVNRINVKAMDQDSGAVILDAEKQFAINEQIKLLVSLAVDLSLHQGFLTGTPECFNITDLGVRVLAHMVALDAWMKDISEAQRTLRDTDIVRLQTK